MTRKDYVLIAARIRAVTGDPGIHAPTVYAVARSIANGLSGDNYRFDHARFLEASGVVVDGALSERTKPARCRHVWKTVVSYGALGFDARCTKCKAVRRFVREE